ncbi:MAG: aldehyde dehydrogenase family protein [Novosphingobium sp.]
MQLDLLIDGVLCPGASTIDVFNPATGEVIAKAACADVAQADAAIAAANRAQSAWAKMGYSNRATLLNKLADELEARQAEFARLLVQEQGKPLVFAEHEIMASYMMLRTVAGLSLDDRVLRDTPEGSIIEMRKPLGVVAAITPWNFPMFSLMVKFAPALAAGNTLVAKPAPTTPLCALLLGEICRDVLPPGVVNIITDRNDLGGYLTSHPDIAKISFTGSTATGRKVMASAAQTIKRITLELGGNDPAIVLDDMDPKDAARALFNGSMVNSGQVCLAIKRAYVPASLYEAICDELVTLADNAVVDDGFAQGVEFGPLQNRAQFDKVMDFIESARREGKIIAGGEAIDRPGYFIRPTIVRDVADDARIVAEEQFGPVLPVLSYSDLDDVIQRANATTYGLAATVWGRDMKRATDVAQRIDAGTVWINKHMDMPFDVPVRGAKQSGFGVEFGLEGLKEFTQAQIVNAGPAS